MYDSEYQGIVKRVNNRYRRRVAFLINAGLFGVVFMSAVLFPRWRNPFYVPTNSSLCGSSRCWCISSGC